MTAPGSRDGARCRRRTDLGRGVAADRVSDHMPGPDPARPQVPAAILGRIEGPGPVVPPAWRLIPGSAETGSRRGVPGPVPDSRTSVEGR